MLCRQCPCLRNEAMDAATMSRAPHTGREACASSPPAGGLDRPAPCKRLRSTQVPDRQASAPQVCQASRLQGLPVRPCAGDYFSQQRCAQGSSQQQGRCWRTGGPVLSSCSGGSSIQRPGCSWPQREPLIAWHWAGFKRHSLASSQGLAASQLAPQAVAGARSSRHLHMLRWSHSRDCSDCPSRVCRTYLQGAFAHLSGGSRTRCTAMTALGEFA